MMPSANVKPVRRVVRDESVRAYVQSTLGYRARCGCDWKGPFRVTFSLARSDAAAHNRSHRGAPNS